MRDSITLGENLGGLTICLGMPTKIIVGSIGFIVGNHAMELTGFAGLIGSIGIGIAGFMIPEKIQNGIRTRREKRSRPQENASAERSEEPQGRHETSFRRITTAIDSGKRPDQV